MHEALIEVEVAVQDHDDARAHRSVKCTRVGHAACPTELLAAKQLRTTQLRRLRRGITTPPAVDERKEEQSTSSSGRHASLTNS